MGPESTLRARARPSGTAAEAGAWRDPWRRVTRLKPTTLAWIALAGLLVAAAAFFYYETRGTTLWVDEWDWAQNRRGWDLDTFLRPHNGHLSLVPVAIYKLLFATAGLTHYAPYRIVLIAAHLLCVALVFVYASRRVGSYLGVIAAALILFLGPAWQNILSPFQVAWLISLAAGLGALLMLDRGDRAGDIVASALLAVSIASSSLGIAVAVGVALEVLWGRRRWRDAWIVAAPLALYALWWVPYHDVNAFARHNIILTPGFVADSAASAVAALAGLEGHGTPDAGVTLLDWGRPLAVAAVALLVWRLTRLGRVPPRVPALLAIALSFWILTALNRAQISAPFAGRYVYVGAFIVVLLAVEVARGVSLDWRAAVLIGAASAAAIVSNIGSLRDGARILRSNAPAAEADLGALEAARPLVKARYVATAFPGYPFVVVRAGPYFAAAKSLGSLAATPAEIATKAEDPRRIADTELFNIHRVALQPAPPPRLPGVRPAVDSVAGGTVRGRGPCVSYRPSAVIQPGITNSVDVTLPLGGLRLTAEGGPATISVRRFADELRPVGAVAAATPALLRIAPDLAPQPWHVRIAPAERATVCGVG